MLIHSTLTAVLLCLASLAAAKPDTNQDGSRKIPTVSTWGELSKVEPIDLGGGVRVRLAVDSNEVPAGGQFVLYCLTEGVEPEAVRRLGHDRLGPLDFELRRYEQIPQVRRRMAEQMVQVAADGPRIEKAELLYSVAIFVPDEGRFELHFARPNEETPLASTIVIGTKTDLPDWTPFRATFPGADALTPDERKAGVEAIVRNTGGPAVIPVWRPMRPIVWKGTVDGRPFARDGAEPLPTTRQPESMTLTHDAGVLRLTMKHEIGRRADMHLIARWWVNDQPFRTERKPDQPWNFSGAVRQEKECVLRLDFDPAALGAKSGDRIKVQLAICPQGWQNAWAANVLAMRQTQIQIAEPGDPRRFGPAIISNTVELVVP